MKTPIIAAILLALAAPAFAGHSQLTKKDVFDVYLLNDDCNRGGAATLTEEESDKACKDFERIIKKMDDLGYCVMGHIFIARKGRPWTKKEWERMGFPGTWRGKHHCYKLRPERDARIIRYQEQYDKEEPWVQARKGRCEKHPELDACKWHQWESPQ